MTSRRRETESEHPTGNNRKPGMGFSMPTQFQQRLRLEGMIRAK
jgi:hypothetical protein